jgi:hypothetical protein
VLRWPRYKSLSLTFRHFRDRRRRRRVGHASATDKTNRFGGEYFAFVSPIMSTPDNAPAGLQRDPDDWKTGDEPMTAAQRSYLETLCNDTGETFDQNLTKAEASKRIDELRHHSPRLTGEEGLDG